MTVFRRLLRPSLVALAAICGTFLATSRMAQASLAEGRGCVSAPAFASCCAGHPESCTSGCCTSSAALSQTETNGLAAPVGPSTARTVCIPSACHCRSSEPAAPNSKPDRRTGDERSNVGDSVFSAWLEHVVSPAPAALFPWDPGGQLHRPLYLLTTHLRF